MLPKNPTLVSKIIKAAEEDMSVAELEYIGLSLRVINSLEESAFNLIYIKDLIKLSEKQITSIDNLGASGFKQISKVFNRFDQLEKEKNKWDNG